MKLTDLTCPTCIYYNNTLQDDNLWSYPPCCLRRDKPHKPTGVGCGEGQWWINYQDNRRKHLPPVQIHWGTFTTITRPEKCGIIGTKED